LTSLKAPATSPRMVWVEPQGEAMTRKTWREKFDGAPAPHLKVLPRPFLGVPAGGKMLIASPLLVDGYIRAIPQGETRTVPQMRQDLARTHHADVTCPTSTGIFMRIVAETALEELAAGAPADWVAPFWRIVDPSDRLAAKLSCGPDGIVRLRRIGSGKSPKP
jgi:hypothetical protein